MVRTGWYFAALPALAAGLVAWAGWWYAFVVLVALAGFILFFFRDPERSVPAEPGLIVSPADGRVLRIEEVQGDGGPATRISIFLSLFDVHVNRAPVAGRIASLDYKPGSFLVASRDEAGKRNERNTITMEGEGGRVVFSQIAGLIARRIEFWHPTGAELARGQRVGMIRFGSRTEIVFDASYRPLVRPGDKVYGGSTVLARRT